MDDMAEREGVRLRRKLIPQHLYHGTLWRNWDSIQREGLHAFAAVPRFGCAEQRIYLAASPWTAVDVVHCKMRKFSLSEPVVILRVRTKLIGRENLIFAGWEIVTRDPWFTIPVAAIDKAWAVNGEPDNFYERHPIYPAGRVKYGNYVFKSPIEERLRWTRQKGPSEKNLLTYS